MVDDANHSPRWMAASFTAAYRGLVCTEFRVYSGPLAVMEAFPNLLNAL